MAQAQPVAVTPKDTSEIGALIERLASQAGVLHECIDALGKRIDPVLGENFPCVAEAPRCVRETALGRSLDDRLSGIEVACQRLTTLTERVRL